MYASKYNLIQILRSCRVVLAYFSTDLRKHFCLVQIPEKNHTTIILICFSMKMRITESELSFPWISKIISQLQCESKQTQLVMFSKPCSPNYEYFITWITWKKRLFWHTDARGCFMCQCEMRGVTKAATWKWKWADICDCSCLPGTLFGHNKNHLTAAARQTGQCWPTSHKIWGFAINQTDTTFKFKE